jgi:hypothetical protein
MDEIGFWPRVLLATLATWRVTHLFTREDGPVDLLVRVRKRLGASVLGRLMDCFQCASLWVAAPAALFVTHRPMTWLVTWLALSGAVCLLERIGSEPLIIQQRPEYVEGADDHGMLRSEASGTVEDHHDVDSAYVTRN